MKELAKSTGGFCSFIGIASGIMKEPLLTEAAGSLTCSGAVLTLQVPQAYLL